MLRVTTVFTGPDIRGGGINRMHFVASGGNASDAQSAVVQWWTDFVPNITLGNSCVVLGTVDGMNPVNGEINDQIVLEDVPIAFQAAGETLPAATQALARFSTGVFFEGRQVRGRIFMPAFSETANIDGAVAPAVVAKIALQGQVLIDDAQSQFGIWHRPVFNAEGELVRDGAIIPAVSASAWNQWAILRSRRD